jgi:hypothetical protein
MTELRRVWSDFWFRPESPVNLAVARVFLAVSALWVVLSRPDLPSILEFPATMWHWVSPERHIRFLLLFNIGTEKMLWYALHVALVLTLVGVATRWTALAAGLLLYHFAPLESIFRSANPYLLGFTTPCLGLILVAISASGGAFRRNRRESSWQNRWPVAAIEFLLCAMYFFAGYSKLFATGLAWVEPRNIRNTILVIDQALGFTARPSLGLWIADHPLLCGMISVGGLIFELIFPLVMVSKIARSVLVPLAFMFHILNAIIFRIYFQSILLLLVFVDWQGLVAKRRMVAASTPLIQTHPET